MGCGKEREGKESRYHFNRSERGKKRECSGIGKVGVIRN